MKKIINYFIRYHVAVNVIIIAFLLFGTLGVKSLKSSFFPLTESHVVQISVTYPGASPMEIEEGVILKIEDNLKGLVGVERVTSVSRENSGNITVEVEEDHAESDDDEADHNVLLRDEDAADLDGKTDEKTDTTDDRVYPLEPAMSHT